MNTKNIMKRLFSILILNNIYIYIYTLMKRYQMKCLLCVLIVFLLGFHFDRIMNYIVGKEGVTNVGTAAQDKTPSTPRPQLQVLQEDEARVMRQLQKDEDKMKTLVAEEARLRKRGGGGLNEARKKRLNNVLQAEEELLEDETDMLIQLQENVDEGYELGLYNDEIVQAQTTLTNATVLYQQAHALGDVPEATHSLFNGYNNFLTDDPIGQFVAQQYGIDDGWDFYINWLDQARQSAQSVLNVLISTLAADGSGMSLMALGDDGVSALETTL